MRFRKNLHCVLTSVPGPAVKTNSGCESQPFWQRLLPGWVGRVSTQSGASGTRDRGLSFPHSSPRTPVLPRLPKCWRARVRVHTHTRTPGLARAQSALRQGRRASLPPRRAYTQVAEQEEGGAKEKKYSSATRDFLPANFPNDPLGRTVWNT